MSTWYGAAVDADGWSLVVYEGRDPVEVIASGLSAEDIDERLKLAKDVLGGLPSNEVYDQDQEAV